MSGAITSKRLLGGIFALLLLCLPAAVLAQDGGPDEAAAEERPSADLTEEQLVLNDEGVRSLIEGDYAGAVAMLTRSIKLGPSNVAYLNLGRAYQKMGNCGDAREALQKVKTAPVVDNPPPREVSKRADEFMEELRQECEFDDQPEEPGAEEQPEKTSGAPPESDELPNPKLRPEPRPEPEQAGAGKTWGIVSMASGLAIIGGGVGLHFWAVDERSVVDEPEQRNGEGQIVRPTQSEVEDIQDKANRIDTAALGMVIGGTVLTGLGTYLFFTSDSPERQSTLSISPGNNRVTIQWRMQF